MEIQLNILQRAREFFSSDYAEARAKFRDACRAEGLPIVEYVHPLPGPDGTVLATDAALLGPADACKLLIVISGTHGVEGLAGSGGQIGWLTSELRRSMPADTAVLFVHMLNPWGSAWRRRQTEDNVDLNRNFVEFDGELPENALYRDVHPIIVGGAAGCRAKSDAGVRDFRAERGEQALANALFAGQYDHGDGVGFGGDQAGWSNLTLNAVLGDFARAADHVAVIDIHTGLGPFGHGMILCLDDSGSAGLERARDWFGPGVLSPHDDGAIPYKLGGTTVRWIAGSLPAQTTAIALEFGTFELAKMLELQIDDCRMHNAQGHETELGMEIRQELQDFFYPATDDWVQSVLLRTAQMIDLALDGLDRAGEVPQRRQGLLSLDYST
ncbi:M14 family metallopeptidase [Sphingomonas sp. M1-B02]|uniref:M14 family metallopeptidase n=1 Tax=Sphingomonas sp. M1-B02 TaxID=3114300 RepID=UPI00224080FA|nr:M14 family metallopeptidase [Sphingomonas sp. S6-11]UZK65431.1 M14 family metallopeptidase [Sphingomonas sp. S6-11]